MNNNVNLGEVIQIINGYAIKSSSFCEKGVGVIKIKNLVDGNIKFLNEYFVDDSFVFGKEKYTINNGDILISMTGSGPNQPASAVGKIAMSKNTESYFMNQRVGKIIPTNINKTFLYYSLLNPRCGNYFLSNSTGSANQANISPAIINSYKINLPPIEEQIYIANRISVYDDKIENNNKIIALLEEKSSLLYKRYFVDFEFLNEEGKPYKSSGGEFKESTLGLIPNDFEVTNLGSKYFPLIKTGIEKFEGTKKYIATADVSDTNLFHNYSDITMEDKPSRANMTPISNSVWYAKMKDSRKLIRVSDTNIEYYKDIIFSTGFAGHTCEQEYYNYLWAFIILKEFDDAKNNLCHGTTMQAINNGNIKNIELIYPSFEVVNEFNKLVEPIFSSIENYNYQSLLCKEKRDILIQELIK